MIDPQTGLPKSDSTIQNITTLITFTQCEDEIVTLDSSMHLRRFRLVEKDILNLTSNPISFNNFRLTEGQTVNNEAFLASYVKGTDKTKVIFIIFINQVISFNIPPQSSNQLPYFVKISGF